MKAYHLYTIEDFVQDVYFREWVFSALPEQDDFWPTWLTAHPEQLETVEQARRVVLSLRIVDIPVDHLGVPEAINRILADRYTVRTLPVYQRTWFKVAASILIICGIGIGVGQRFWPARQSDGASDALQQVALTEKRRLLTFPDGSTVTLEPDSRVQISPDFGHTTREVTLVGEGFFEVVKDPDKPFLVNTGKIVTRVLGTTFSIKAYKSDTSISVSVRTGKVTVYRTNERRQDRLASVAQVVLTPNQRAVFNNNEEQLVKTLVDKPIIISSKAELKTFEFVETPVPQVLKQLSEAYGVNMFYDAEILANCNLTASLNNQGLYQKLDLICEAINASYKITDGQIILTGNGCD